jgi:hypothetical protein
MRANVIKRAVAGCAVIVGGCAPISSPPHIADPGGVPVSQVVQRIKCELIHAIIEPMRDDQMRWFRRWTAKVDLTLNVSTLDQLNPTVVFNNPLHNVYPNVGTSSLPGTTLAAFQQKFTFGVGGGVADQRARSEDFSFTLSFIELKEDFEKLAKIDPRYSVCLDPAAALPDSNLDMQAWIRSRFLPLVQKVDGYQILKEGYHQQVATPAAKAPPVLAPKAPFDEPAGVDRAIKAAKQATDDFNYIVSQILPLAQKIGNDCLDAVSLYGRRAKNIDATADSSVAAAKKANGKDQLDAAVLSAIDAQTKADSNAKSALAEYEACHPDKNPPLDLISANYQFSVAANIGISPSWTLLRVTGPSGNGSAASAAGAWTNNLSLILAPSVSSTNGDVLNERLIQTLRPQPAPPPAPAF